MAIRKLHQVGLLTLFVSLLTLAANGQSFRVQCPATTMLHPTPAPLGANPDGGQIKCQQVSGGDGYATMADGTQTYLFAFGPLSGLNDLASGLPGTQQRSVFMTPFDPAAGLGTAASNGAVGIVPDADGQVDPATGFSLCTGANPPASCFTGHVDPRQIMDVGVMNGNIPAPMMAIDEDDEFFLTLTNVGMIMRPDLFEQHTIHFHGYPTLLRSTTAYPMLPSPSTSAAV